MCPASGCLLEVDLDTLIICNGKTQSEIGSSKEASMEVGRVSSLVLPGKENEARAMGPYCKRASSPAQSQRLVLPSSSSLNYVF